MPGRVGTRTVGSMAARPRVLPAASGVVMGVSGLAFLGVGLWARRTVEHSLARENIVSTPDASPPNAPVRSAEAARSLAEVIRSRALAAAGGRTYAETEAYLGANGEPTSDAGSAAKDERTGAPLENPDHALWLQATTLETALMQAYLAFRLADLTIALGGTLALAGAGIAATGAARR
jgi:hypothetical protein